MKKVMTLLMCCFLAGITQAQTWSAVGNGVVGEVTCFAVYEGDLYAGGQLYEANGNSTLGLMRWNGTLFDTLPGNYLFGENRIEALEVYNGELYIGGEFSTLGTNPSAFSGIAKWNGTTFSAVGSGTDLGVAALEVYHGDLYAGGGILHAGSIPVTGIAKWNGTTWSAVGTPLTSGGVVIFELEVYNDELYAAGNFYYDVLNTWCIVRWNDTTWNEVGSGGIQGVVYALGLYNNKLYAGGPYFTNAGGSSVDEIAAWDGTTWSAVGSGIGLDAAHIFALKAYHNELYAGGTFNIMDGDSIKSIARYNGVVWNSVGTGLDSINTIVDTLIGWPTPNDITYIYALDRINAFIEFNNELYAGGIFNIIGGVTAHNVAKWSTPVGLNELQSSQPITVFPNPTIDKVFIKGQEANCFYKLYDASGQLLLQGNTDTKEMELQLQSLNSGIYFLSISNESKNYQAKIIRY